MQLSQKVKILSEFLFAFSKFKFAFEHFKKQGVPHSWCIFELPDTEKRGYINVEKSRFRRSFDK